MQASSGNVELWVYEAPVTSDNGTLLHPATNKNRGSTNTEECIFYTGPTVTDENLLLKKFWLATTTGGSGRGASNLVGAGGEKWIFKENVNYLFRIINNSGIIIDFLFDFGWMEQTS